MQRSRRRPDFFVGRPVVLDLSALSLSQAAITHLVTSLHARNIRVLGFEGVDASKLTADLPPVLTSGRPVVIEQQEQQKKPEEKPRQTSLLLDSPVRSGQSVVFMDGDVTVLGSVGSGAEIVAGALSMFTARYVAARWQASTAIQARGFTAKRSRRSCSPSTVFTELQKTSMKPCVIGPLKRGSTAT